MPERPRQRLLKPAHTVTLTGFLIGKYEVTQADWREVMGADPPELYNKGCDDCPVENVSWNEMQEFIKTLNKVTTGRKTYRLPTEAEWEYAARGGPKSEGYIYSGSNEAGKVAWYHDNYKTGNTFGARKSTRPVGTKVPNELGLHDMSGNVYEWCSDWKGEYPADAQVNPTGPKSGSNRILRGGSWNYSPQYVRAALRYYLAPGDRYYSIGFRLARTN
ncbi:MAG: Serine/threonine-protein kinase pkn1 [Saprospiraceae bacterium]|nr:Serine/threonine-protein kinase pkn1 [Saprospiraceae bacterium]